MFLFKSPENVIKPLVWKANFEFYFLFAVNSNYILFTCRGNIVTLFFMTKSKNTFILNLRCDKNNLKNRTII